ncbi:hypothetical protein F4808DRAFT_467236 [Astrocystis sublimbata]|nr:hypothetical protein F4808DRAFT_454339 [Astrocystis sublimbata]KAI0187641.1 hypothetical protein F4808DRAFT_454335 [Astrocystis sublimbata]KAI0189660.1 hypothetical protein F4808DRAFT_467236 [Astrocystis sublimbata]
MPPARVSNACEPCRKKRRKCSQCRRAKTLCPGYRDPFTSRIRDQSQSTVRKFQTRQQHESSQSASSQLAPPALEQALTSSTGIDLDVSGQVQCRSSLHSENEDTTVLLWTSHLSDDITQTALAYFMHTYATQSFFAYLPNLYGCIPSEDRSDVDFIVSVPALVLLSQHRRDASLMRFAYARHAAALAKTQNALASPNLVIRDSTLLSVLLLALFEALVFRGRQTPQNWMTHMQGSTALLSIRGKGQFDTALGQRLFVHCSGNLASRYSAKGLPVPPFLKPLQDYAASIGAIDDLGVRMGIILNEFAALRANAVTISAAQRLRELLDLKRKITASLEIMTVVAPYEKLDDSAHTPQKVRSYKGCYSNECILETNFPVDAVDVSPSDLPLVYEGAAQSAENAIHDILSSVPYHIEFSNDPCNTARALILPLSAILSSELTPLSPRLFARERLSFIGTEYGLVQAQESAAMTETPSTMEDWMLVSHWS